MEPFRSGGKTFTRSNSSGSPVSLFVPLKLSMSSRYLPGSGIPLYFLDGVEDLPYVDLK